MSQPNRIASLDGLRAFAILLVLAQHSFPQRFLGAGLVGVDVFFVLSGFLITNLLLQEHRADSRINFYNFYGRRFVRLLPALAAMLVAFIASSLIFDLYSVRETLASAFFAFTYTTPIALPFVDIAEPVQPTWTLATEEWFYLAWPAVLALMLSRGRSADGLLRRIVVAIAGFTVLRLLTFAIWGSDIYFWPGTWADALLAGCALAVLLFHDRWTWTVPTWVPWVAAAYLVGLAVWKGTRTSVLSFGPGLTLLWVAVVLIVVVSMQAPDSLAIRPLRWPVLVWIGRRSYGIYLFNALFLKQDIGLPWSDNVNALVGLLLTFVAAEASWRLVEAPANKLRRHFGRAGTETLRDRRGAPEAT